MDYTPSPSRLTCSETGCRCVFYVPKVASSDDPYAIYKCYNCNHLFAFHHVPNPSSNTTLYDPSMSSSSGNFATSNSANYHAPQTPIANLINRFQPSSQPSSLALLRPSTEISARFSKVPFVANNHPVRLGEAGRFKRRRTSAATPPFQPNRAPGELQMVTQFDVHLMRKVFGNRIPLSHLNGSDLETMKRMDFIKVVTFSQTSAVACDAAIKESFANILLSQEWKVLNRIRMKNDLYDVGLPEGKTEWDLEALTVNSMAPLTSTRNGLRRLFLAPTVRDIEDMIATRAAQQPPNRSLGSRSRQRHEVIDLFTDDDSDDDFLAAQQISRIVPRSSTVRVEHGSLPTVPSVATTETQSAQREQSGQNDDVIRSRVGQPVQHGDSDLESRISCELEHTMMIQPFNGRQASASPSAVGETQFCELPISEHKFLFPLPVDPPPIENNVSVELLKFRLLHTLRTRAHLEVAGGDVVRIGNELNLTEGNELQEALMWLRTNNSLADLLSQPSLETDGAIDHGGPYRDGMFRIFAAFSRYEHCDFGGALFSGEGIKLVSRLPAVSKHTQKVLLSFGKMLFYGFVHGHAWATWFPALYVRQWLGLEYDRNIVHQLSPTVGDLALRITAFATSAEAIRDSQFRLFAEIHQYHDMSCFLNLTVQELAEFIVDDELIRCRKVNSDLIRQGFDQGALIYELTSNSLWPMFEEVLYHTVTTAYEFLAQFDRNSISGLTDHQEQLWDWMQTFLLNCSAKQLQNGLRFFTGSVFIPTPSKIKVHFFEGNNDVPRLPFARTCVGKVEIDESFQNEGQFHHALEYCFTDEQYFGHR